MQNTDVTGTLLCTDTGSASTTYELDAGATQNGASVAVYGDGIHTIAYRSTDNAGNVETTNTATVMIDKTPPDVTTSGNMPVEATGPSGATATFSGSATDALSGVVGGASCSPASGSTFPLGSTTVTCSATDSHGNTSTGSFVITVCQSGRPAIELICPTVFGGPDWFWKDRVAGIMTIRYTLVNGTGTDAYNVKITGSTANNGVTTLTPIPVSAGNLVSGTSVMVSIDYLIPTGVRSMTVSNTVCADDQCGTTYFYPVTP